MEEEDTCIVGIDLGTTNSLVAVVDSGFPIVLADEEGRRILPSVVSWRKDGVLIGEPAARGRLLHPGSTVASVKRLMGRGFSSLTPEEIAEYPCEMAGTQGEGVELILGEAGRKTPEQVSAEILKRLKETAEFALEHPVERAVITVPAYFNHAQREATRRAAELAGWRVERILNEPTAAALAYGFRETGEEVRRIAVYDFGGGTFDLSVLELREGVFEVIATAGDTRLGGDDIDRAVVEWLLEEISLDGQPLTVEQEVTLFEAARKAKEALSEQEETTVSLPFFDGKRSFEATLTSGRLAELALPFLERTRRISRGALLEAEQKTGQAVDHLILVGGSTRMPLVREKLEEWFGMKPDVSQHPDEAVAIGAAIQAGILCGRVKETILLDVVPLSLGIETIGGLMNIIIPRNTTIPVKAGEMFTNAVANQESMAVRVLQGEREMARDNWLLGEITVPFQPGAKGSARVGVEFSIDQNGILTVLTRDTATGRDLTLKIESAAVDVNDEAVERMISESVDFAFDDMNERMLTETRMKSEELLPAVEAALGMAGDRLSDEEREGIEKAAAEVKRCLEGEAPVLADWKKANAALDEATQHLAALLVEMALDDSLPGDA